MLAAPDPGVVAAAVAAAPIIPLADVTTGLPIPNPARILCVGLNYHDHRAESAAKVTSEHPTFFTRFVSSLVPDGVALERPKASDVFDYEGELAVVIGRPGRAIAVADAIDHVGGYSCFMDGSVRDYQRHSSQFTAGKNFERSGSFGPLLVTPDELDLPAAELRTTVERPGGPARAAQGHDPLGRRAHRLRLDLDDARAGRRDRHRHARAASATPAHPRCCSAPATRSRSRSPAIGTLTNPVIAEP